MRQFIPKDIPENGIHAFYIRNCLTFSVESHDLPTVSYQRFSTATIGCFYEYYKKIHVYYDLS
jgi:hypothetical protein